jgi:hypothetical protein
MQDELECVNRLIDQMRTGGVSDDRLDVSGADKLLVDTAILLTAARVTRKTRKGRSRRRDAGSGPA